MCPQNKRVGAATAQPNWMLLATTVVAGAASNVVVNPICNAIWKSKETDSEGKAIPNPKASANAGFVKIAAGLGLMLYGDNEYLAAAGLGMVGDGGSQLLRAKMPAFQGLRALPTAARGVGTMREVIDLSSYNVNGVESDFAVGNTNDFAVSGGVM